MSCEHQLKQNVLVSVVVPVYGVEKYLDRCVESIINQTYRNIEIILIDDGSLDNCPKMCDAWAQRDPRIRVIHKKNEGQGIARNIGIDNSKGEYIVFCDADDYISDKLIEETLEVAIDNNVDIVCFGLHAVNVYGEIALSMTPSPMQNIYRGRAIREKLLPDLIGPNLKTGSCINTPVSACCKLISMNLIKSAKWSFVSEREIVSEDLYSMYELYGYADCIFIIPKSYYYYCENYESFSRKYKSNRVDLACTFYNKSIELCDVMGFNEAVKYQMSVPFFDHIITALKQAVGHYKSPKQRINRIRYIVNTPLVQKLLNEHKRDKIGVKKKILFWAMRHKQYTLVMVLLMLRLKG